MFSLWNNLSELHVPTCYQCLLKGVKLKPWKIAPQKHHHYFAIYIDGVSFANELLKGNVQII